MSGLLLINMHFKCNAKCVFCVVGIPDIMRGTVTNSGYEVMEAGLKKGIADGYRRLCLSGGEPTIHEDFFKVIKKAKELGYESIEVKTNGIKLKEYSFVKKMIDSGVDTFCISIQGPDSKIHDSLVGVHGAFNAIIEAIKHIHSLGGTLVIPTCVQKGNYKYLPETMELFKKLKSRQCIPTFIETNGSAYGNFSRVVPRYSEVLPYLKEAVQRLKGSNVNLVLHGFPMCLIRGNESLSMDLFRKNDKLVNENFTDYGEYEKQHFRSKDERCDLCCVTSFCGGPWANYVKEYGYDEFLPITGKSVTDIIPASVLVENLFAHDIKQQY